MSLVPTPPSSEEKILSTHNSRNSTLFALGSLNGDPPQNESCDSSLRLYTFMNQHNEKALRDGDKNKKTKATSFRRVSNKCLKRESSGLISLIEESRKKREDFLKLILDDEPSMYKEKNRQCKTPTHPRHSVNNLGPKNLPRKSVTPRVSINCKDSFGFGPSTSRNKLQRSKLPLNELDQNIQVKQESRKTKKKTEKVQKKQPIIPGGLENLESSILIKKKKELEQQLMEINQTLLLGRNRKKSGLNKNK